MLPFIENHFLGRIQEFVQGCTLDTLPRGAEYPPWKHSFYLYMAPVPNIVCGGIMIMDTFISLAMRSVRSASRETWDGKKFPRLRYILFLI